MIQAFYISVADLNLMSILLPEKTLFYWRIGIRSGDPIFIFLRLVGAIQIIRDTLGGGRGLAKVSPNITMGEGVWQKYHVTNFHW